MSEVGIFDVYSGGAYQKQFQLFSEAKDYAETLCQMQRNDEPDCDVDVEIYDKDGNLVWLGEDDSEVYDD